MKLKDKYPEKYQLVQRISAEASALPLPSEVLVFTGSREELEAKAARGEMGVSLSARRDAIREAAAVLIRQVDTEMDRLTEMHFALACHCLRSIDGIPNESILKRLQELISLKLTASSDYGTRLAGEKGANPRFFSDCFLELVHQLNEQLCQLKVKAAEGRALAAHAATQPQASATAMGRELQEILAFFPEGAPQLQGPVAYEAHHIQALLCANAGDKMEVQKTVIAQKEEQVSQISSTIEQAVARANSCQKSQVVPLYFGEGGDGHWVGVVVSPKPKNPASPSIYLIDDERNSGFTRALRDFIDQHTQMTADFAFRQYRQAPGSNDCGPIMVDLCINLATNPGYRYRPENNPQTLRQTHEQQLQQMLVQFSAQREGAATAATADVPAALSLQEMRAARLRIFDGDHRTDTSPPAEPRKTPSKR